MSDRVRIGDLLVAAKLVTAAQVEEALASQRESGRRLGEELVVKGFVSEVQLTQILSNQLAIPWVSLQRIEFTRELLNMVPAEVANRLCAIPIYMRRVRSAETLYVALDDPTNEAALEELALTTGLPVKAMVSAPSEIRHAIRVYYLGGAPQVHAPERRASRHPEETPASREVVVIPKQPSTGLFADTEILPPDADAWESGAAPATPAPEQVAAPAPPPVEPEAEPAPAPEPEPVVASPPPAAEAPVATEDPGLGAPEVASARAPGPEPEPKAEAAPEAEPAGVRMITLTLLDGTTVRLPAPGSKKKAVAQPSEGALTASDLVSALVARAQGADVSDVLPDQQWEVLFASLLTLLIRKGLLADWEFVEEWKKRQGS